MKRYDLARAAGVAVMACLALPCFAPGAVVLDGGLIRLEIADNGALAGLVAVREGRQLARLQQPTPIAMIYRGGRSVPTAEGPFAAVIGRWVYTGGERFPASAVHRQGDRLMIDFAPANVRAVCRVWRTDAYLALELLGIEGEPVDRIEFLRLRLPRTPLLGEWVNVAGDDRFAACLCGGNVRTEVEMLPEHDNVLITAAAERSVGLVGATAVLLGCPEPKKQFLDAMARVETDFHLPAGASARRSPLQKLSYLWASPLNPQNVDGYIDFARRGGFRMILFSYTAFSTGPGHFAWNMDYPRGMADLERVTGAIRAAGLKLGLHIHYSKAGKRDAYVTPVPDPRLHVERPFTLAAGVAADSTTLPVREDPAGATLDAGRRLLKLDRELIEYGAYRRVPRFEFTGCRRGTLGTKAAPHTAGTLAGLLDVDTWPAFIRLDQTTDIQDEVARRVAEIYRRTGPYDMVYFDGAEDVHEPFWYHVASSQYRVFRLLDPPPSVCESAHYTHFSWHMISRSNAYDTVAPPEGMKDFCRLMPCPTAASRANDFSRIQFGWLGNFGRSRRGCAGPDVFEYVASRAAAWDCPVALHASLEELRSNPRAEDCLAAIRIWEDARLGNHLSEADRVRLRNVAPADARYVPCFQQRAIFDRVQKGNELTPVERRILADRREHHLFINEQGRYELVELEEVPNVAGGRVKAFLFRRAARPADAYLLAWAREGELRLRLPVRGLSAMRPLGKPVDCRADGEGSELVVGPRTYLLLRDTSLDAARRLVGSAQIAP